MNKEEIKKLETTYVYHEPINDQIARYKIIRSNGKSLASHIINLCPESRERSLALTKVEEAVMWANSAIARNEGQA